jgi:hypothetical protein
MISNGRRPLMGGNWKLNPTKVNKAKELATEVNIEKKKYRGENI